ncbi:MAG TPA: 50S ribosomal protein L6 [Candidatus Sulfotelmatobacter sp.]|nr:50S ribosomal protein L6 [Candidatus Sulfotelmatobacter sp.]
MSRVGKQPINLPSGVSVVTKDAEVSVSGPKGTLSRPTLEGIKISQDGDKLVLTRKNDEALYRARHGLMRSLVDNMVTGVNDGFSKKLELSGVGYRVNLAGQELKMNLGFSHEVVYKLPEGITASVDQNTITVSGIDKQRVGQTAAEIRALKKPEPYKGKGIHYVGERILRKSGKSGKEK